MEDDIKKGEGGWRRERRGEGGGGGGGNGKEKRQTARKNERMRAEPRRRAH